MRLFVAGMTLLLLLLLLAPPAQAQQAGRPQLQNDGPQKETPKPKADEKAYGNALSRMPTKQYDPWKDMR